jgi:hypothetical protein
MEAAIAVPTASANDAATGSTRSRLSLMLLFDISSSFRIAADVLRTLVFAVRLHFGD